MADLTLSREPSTTRSNAHSLYIITEWCKSSQCFAYEVCWQLLFPATCVGAHKFCSQMREVYLCIQRFTFVMALHHMISKCAIEKLERKKRKYLFSNYIDCFLLYWTPGRFVVLCVSVDARVYEIDATIGSEIKVVWLVRLRDRCCFSITFCDQLFLFNCLNASNCRPIGTSQLHPLIDSTRWLSNNSLPASACCPCHNN